ncbi:hypothetical protein QQP08_002034 [Theobroma cacao]|nr:hypothetical protein QQP08_002034 [Theobroma cacao]
MKNNPILLLILYRLNMIRGKRLSYPSLSIAHTSYHFTLFHQMIGVSKTNNEYKVQTANADYDGHLASYIFPPTDIS